MIFLSGVILYPIGRNILHTSTQEILEEIRFDTLGDVETKLKELCDHKVLRKANILL